MALAKDLQTPICSFYGSMLEGQFPHISPYGFDEYNQKQDGDGLDLDMESPNNNNSNKMMSNQVMSHSPPLSSSSSANSSNGSFAIHHHHPQAATGYGSFINSSGGPSFLSFQNQDHHHYPLWENANTSLNLSSNLRVLEEVSCLQSASSGYQDDANEWLYAEPSVAEPPQESATQPTCFNKRPHMEEENIQALKKQCTTSASKKPAKPKASTSKDPQSIAAKNRRERISERLKILQDLVPNGSKVDLVTMLEKAIGYVKFLQLQVKVLATDEFWPAAGGKAPDISQVREAIDAILSSQRSEKATSSSPK